jgi:hypothetical protein
MNSNINTRILATIFAVVIALSAAMLVTTTGGTLMLTPAFAQGDNITGGGNVTEGNVTTPDLGDGGAAAPPVLTP